MIRRRDFILDSAAFAGLAAALGCQSLSSGGQSVRFGIVSDTHVTGPECVGELERALCHFRNAGVDAVLHCGDITNLGYLDELAVFEETWKRVMPPDVGFIAAFGNRDLSDTKKFPPELRKRDAAKLIVNSGRRFGIRDSEVKGIRVIAADWGHEGELESYLFARPELREAGRALLVIQHRHPRKTVFDADGWMADDGRAGCYLRLFPQAISFSGHSHRRFDTPESLWRGDYTAAAAGSYYLGPPPDVGGREVSVLDVGPERTVLVRTDLDTGFSKTYDLSPVAERQVPVRRPDEFTFVQWNIGHFAFGRASDTGIAAADARHRAEDYRRAIAGLGADIIGLCEYSAVFDRGGGRTRDLLFGDYAHVLAGPQEEFQSNALFSRRPLSGGRIVPYADRRQRTYALSCTAEVGGRRIVVVQTHLDLDRSARRTQIAELVAAFGREERVIVSGDFNIDDPGEYAPFEAAGFARANFGRFGTFNTHRRRDFSKTPAIDNVFIRGLEFVDVRLDDLPLRLSDHRMLVCRLAPAL